MLREPDQIIGDRYLLRWFGFKSKWFNIYLHKFEHSDDDRALHDHPWWSVSFLLKGNISEIYYEADDLDIPFEGRIPKEQYAKWLVPFYRNAKYAHRVVLHSEAAWTLFITGPHERDWGFYCPRGWVGWKWFCDESGNRRGRGCE
jgi:hypothetical protein